MNGTVLTWSFVSLGWFIFVKYIAVLWVKVHLWLQIHTVQHDFTRDNTFFLIIHPNSKAMNHFQKQKQNWFYRDNCCKPPVCQCGVTLEATQAQRIECEMQVFYIVHIQQYMNYSGCLASNALGPPLVLGWELVPWASLWCSVTGSPHSCAALSVFHRSFPENKASISHICTLQEAS